MLVVFREAHCNESRVYVLEGGMNHCGNDIGIGCWAIPAAAVQQNTRTSPSLRSCRRCSLYSPHQELQMVGQQDAGGLGTSGNVSDAVLIELIK